MCSTNMYGVATTTSEKLMDILGHVDDQTANVESERSTESTAHEKRELERDYGQLMECLGR